MIYTTTRENNNSGLRGEWRVIQSLLCHTMRFQGFLLSLLSIPFLYFSLLYTCFRFGSLLAFSLFFQPNATTINNPLFDSFIRSDIGSLYNIKTTHSFIYTHSICEYLLHDRSVPFLHGKTMTGSGTMDISLPLTTILYYNGSLVSLSTLASLAFYITLSMAIQWWISLVHLYQHGTQSYQPILSCIPHIGHGAGRYPFYVLCVCLLIVTPGSDSVMFINDQY